MLQLRLGGRERRRQFAEHLRMGMQRVARRVPMRIGKRRPLWGHCPTLALLARPCHMTFSCCCACPVALPCVASALRTQSPGGSEMVVLNDPSLVPSSRMTVGTDQTRL